MDREEADPVELVGRVGEDRLLSSTFADLPDRPAPVAPVESPSRRRIVATGVALTAASLIGGLALLIAGAIDGLATGFGPAAVVALVVGLVLIATHWGWVHVAEAIGQSLDRQANQAAELAATRALERIEPHSRWSVRTRAGDDGSVVIEMVRHRPVAAGQDRFTFVREVVERETVADDAPAATAAERAETLRRRAASATAEAAARYASLREQWDAERLAQADEHERRLVAQSTAQALSDQINRHLDDPPLSE